LLPQVLDIAGDLPVLAAGGLVDGRDLAAALSFGAAGVLMGTRFLAASESPISAGYQRAILAAEAGSTIASSIWDMLWGGAWSGVQVRSIRNDMTDRWVGHEDELWTTLASVRAEAEAAEQRQDVKLMPLLAGEGAARIHSVLSSAEIVRGVVADAEQALARAAALVG
jgi:nitronate monooxygenase